MIESSVDIYPILHPCKILKVSKTARKQKSKPYIVSIQVHSHVADMTYNIISIYRTYYD